MARLRVATFNCENLFARYQFNKNIDPAKASKNGFDINMTHFRVLREPEKKLTGDVINALDADVIALQEVENLDVLKRFRGDKLKKRGYSEAMLVDANDPRRIDVGVLSRFPIVAVRSHQSLRDGKGFVFSRDCLEVEIDVKGKRLVLFVNHFKSMLDKSDPKNGRKNTRAKRLKQATAVKKIVQSRFGKTPGKKNWIVLGDFNDFRQAAQGTTSGILGLVNWSEVEDVVLRLPLAEQWTHFFDGAKAGEVPNRQLDYLLLSRSLAKMTTAKPIIERRGLSTQAKIFTGKRFKGVTAKSSASDHCPVAIDVTI